MNRYTFADLVYSACRLSLYPVNWCALYVVAHDCDLIVYNNYRTCWHLTKYLHVAPALRGSQLINGVANRPTSFIQCSWPQKKLTLVGCHRGWSLQWRHCGQTEQPVITCFVTILDVTFRKVPMCYRRAMASTQGGKNLVFLGFNERRPGTKLWCIINSRRISHTWYTHLPATSFIAMCRL